MAWESFGTKNGDPNYERFVRRIEGYRRRLSTPGSAGTGHLRCLALRDSVFLPVSQWVSWKTDEEWSANVVSYKGYDLEVGSGRILAELMRSVNPAAVPDFAPEFVPLAADAAHRPPSLVRWRIVNFYSQFRRVLGPLDEGLAVAFHNMAVRLGNVVRMVQFHAND
jgi:hypothetical protein